MTEVDDHNAARWLVVRYLDGFPGRYHHAGWYVVRCCPCHSGCAVTFPYETEARAERVRGIILGELKTRSEPQREEPSGLCLAGLAANKACRPDETLKRCTICGFVDDTQYA